jgi:hypothetical protein
MKVPVLQAVTEVVLYRGPHGASATKPNAMLKYALLLINFASAMFVTSVLDDGVIIEDNTPATMRPGEERIVEISINKGDVEGFAKLQLDLPEGFVAEAADTYGASFTFSDQKVKFIWMSLPQEQVFTVSYKLRALATASGTKVIGGTFSYIKNNQRIDYEMQNKLVDVSNLSAATANTSTEDQQMQCRRTITEIAKGSYLVKVEVTNATNQGFVKIREAIPAGFEASESESAGAIVTIDKGALKYVWFDAPQSKNYSIVYRLNGGMGDPQINGSFSYVENNAPKELGIINAGPIERSTGNDVVEQQTTNSNDTEAAEAAAAAAAEAEREKQRQIAEAKRAAEEADSIAQSQENERQRLAEIERKRQDEIKRQQAADAAEAAQNANNTSNSNSNTTAQSGGTTIPDPETGVRYKVQIAAAHKVVDAKYFQSRHGFGEKFGIENHEGWVKYTTGSFEVYRGARDDRERIKSRYNFNGPFVTAYNDGVRITVQEALMISRQQWYK